MGLVSCEVSDGIASITMDDGKANALTSEMFEGLAGALDQAEAAGAGVVLAGRDGRFSAGFDLKVMGTASPDAPALLRAGFEMSHRLLSYPYPVVIACSGHAYAMGSFLLLSGDHRFGIAGGDHRITANEVAIGMTMPRGAIEILRQRLTRTHFDRAVILAEVFTPETAVEAGFLDTLVPADELHAAARAKAAALMALNMRAHTTTKLRARHDTLARLRDALEADVAEMHQLIGAS